MFRAVSTPVLVILVILSNVPLGSSYSLITQSLESFHLFYEYIIVLFYVGYGNMIEEGMEAEAEGDVKLEE